MTSARRCPCIAPDHHSAHGPPDHALALVPGDHPSATVPSNDHTAPSYGPSGTDGASTQEPRSADAATALSERERAVYDPEARVFYDVETGKVLADMAAWERASDRERARVRFAAVRHAEELIAGGAKRGDADAAAAAEAGASPRAVREWRGKAARLPEEARAAALLDSKRTGRPSKLTPAMLETLEALAYRRGEHLTAREVQEALLEEHGQAVPLSTAREATRKLKRAKRRELCAVTSPDLDRSRHAPAGGDASAKITRLNQVWELDSTKADMICICGTRCSLVGSIDIWSRRPRVLVVPESRATAIAAILRRCILEWGVPETVRTDQGKHYISKHVAGLLDDLAIEHDRCPPYRPDRKPFIERFLGTMAHEFFPKLPGFTGHNVAQAKALRERKSFAARRGEDDTEVFAADLTIQELQECIDNWCDATYGRRAHTSLGGASPFERAASWQGEVRWVHDARALDALLAEPAGDGWRTICKKGIRLDSAYYIAGPRGSRVGERVKLRRDPTDSGRIHVYRVDGSFVCVAENPGHTRANQTAIAANMTADYRKHRSEARKRARELERRKDPGSAADRALARAATDAARVVALPRKGKAHQTPALAQAGFAAKAADKAKAPQPARCS